MPRARIAARKASTRKDGRAHTDRRTVPHVATVTSSSRTTTSVIACRSGVASRTSTGTLHDRCLHVSDNADAMSSIGRLPLSLVTVPAEVLFWHHCASSRHLRVALSKCDVDWAVVSGNASPVRLPMSSAARSAPFVANAHDDSCNYDDDAASVLLLTSADAAERLCVAWQCLQDARLLLVCFGDDAVDASSTACCDTCSCDVDAASAHRVRATAAAVPATHHAPRQVAAATRDACGEQHAHVQARQPCSQAHGCPALSTLNGRPHHGYVCWVAQRYARTLSALVQLSEAAVPPRGPSLLSAAASLYVSPGESQQSCVDAGVLSSRCVWQPRASVATTTTTTTAASCALVPSPVTRASLDERLACLARLRQLRAVYTTVLPRLRECTTMPAVARVLCLPRATTTSGDDDEDASASSSSSTLAALPASLVSCHRRERDVMQALLQHCNDDCVLCAHAWGVSYTSSAHSHDGDVASATTSGAADVRTRTPARLPACCALQLTGGVYVVHHVARARAMRALLRESELYGLPPFVRSIRRLPHHDGAAANAAQHVDYARRRSAAVARAYAHLLFLSPDALDARVFVRPDAVQAPLVHEELIELAMQHCCFGMLVGEADQVVQLLVQHCQYGNTQASSSSPQLPQEARQEQRLHKDEQVQDARVNDPSAGDDVTDACHGARACGDVVHGRSNDPLARYVQQAQAHARRMRLRAQQAHEQGCDGDARGGNDDVAAATTSSTADACVVQWLCDNRWCVDTQYYGLVYVAVVDSNDVDADDGDGIDTHRADHMDGSVDKHDKVNNNDDDNNNSTDTTRALQRGDGAYYVACVVELTRHVDDATSL